MVVLNLLAGDDIDAGAVVWDDERAVYPFKTLHACYSYNRVEVTNPRTGRIRESRHRKHVPIYSVLNHDGPAFGVALSTAKKGGRVMVMTRSLLIGPPARYFTRPCLYRWV